MDQARKLGGIALIGLLVAGCATTVGSRKAEKEAQYASLESQVSSLARRLEELARGQQTLTQEVEGLKTAPKQPAVNYQAAASRKPSLTTREVQQALANAGFYQGLVDGKEGPKTKQAVRDFQKSQGLTPDGVVGKKTAAALSKFLKEKPKE